MVIMATSTCLCKIQIMKSGSGRIILIKKTYLVVQCSTSFNSHQLLLQWEIWPSSRRCFEGLKFLKLECTSAWEIKYWALKNTQLRNWWTVS
jgi:hypothetical protein